MSYTKPKIYNLALSALLLTRQVVNIETDNSTEVKALNNHWDIALESTLQDLDLDSLSETVELELITSLTEGNWLYVYKYPSSCAFFRRIKSCAETDTSRTHIPKKVGIYQGEKVIFTDEYQASAEIIPKTISLAMLSSTAAMALAYRLAILSAPLVVGKGAKTLIESLNQQYAIAKGEAQETDAAENFNYDPDHVRSEFVAERLS